MSKIWINQNSSLNDVDSYQANSAPSLHPCWDCCCYHSSRDVSWITAESSYCPAGLSQPWATTEVMILLAQPHPKCLRKRGVGELGLIQAFPLLLLDFKETFLSSCSPKHVPGQVHPADLQTKNGLSTKLLCTPVWMFSSLHYSKCWLSDHYVD